MERVIECIASLPALIVPMLALWAIVGLYSQRTGCQCSATQVLYFSVLIVVSGFTVRTVLTDDGFWLAHTASLGSLIVAGVMRRPEEDMVSLVSDPLPIQ
jgi:hypothetical protein